MVWNGESKKVVESSARGCSAALLSVSTAAKRPMRSLMTPRSMSWFFSGSRMIANRLEPLLHALDLLAQKFSAAR